MPEKKGRLSRRDFFKTAGAAGLGTALVSLNHQPAATAADANTTMPAGTIPKRPFGKTGVDVSILSLGGVLRSSDQMVFKLAYQMGVTYWDTADSYGWGKNEKAIGQYLAKYPDHRKNIFLVTKAATSDPNELTEKLKTSLERLKTSYVDMYFVHHVTDVPNELTPAVMRWAEKAKSKGKIRLFGFSTHKNMDACMLSAAKLGWIDGIMMSYNYRLMGTEKMEKAVAACVESGIGLTAMKTQAAFSANFYASIGSETDAALKMTEKLMQKGYTPEQAKLRVVWDNPHIASICSAMPNLTILQANIAAALNKTDLSKSDRWRLHEYALRTAPGYCAGCADICESAISPELPVGDIMRYCMYAYGYGDRATAMHWFTHLPSRVKDHLSAADYTVAEQRCPQKILIGTMMKSVRSDLI